MQHQSLSLLIHILLILRLSITKVLDEAMRMYIDSCGILEDEGKEQMVFDTYRAVLTLI